MTTTQPEEYRIEYFGRLQVHQPVTVHEALKESEVACA